MNWKKNLQLVAGEAMAAMQYHAVALDDGQLANNGEEAIGILDVNDAQSGDFVPVTFLGLSRFAAGGAVSKGDKLTVTTSGWFTNAGSGDTIVGECTGDSTGGSSVTSGSLGFGVFNFVGRSNNPATMLKDSGTAADTFLQGAAVGSGFIVGASANTMLGVANAAASSGSTVNYDHTGETQFLIGAGTVNAGVKLAPTTSGYFIAATSGTPYVGTLLSTTASGALGKGTLNGGYLSA